MYARKLRALIECGLHVTLSVRVDDVHIWHLVHVRSPPNSNSKYYYLNCIFNQITLYFQISNCVYVLFITFYRTSYFQITNI